MDFPNSTGENILDQDLVGYLIESGDKVNDNSGNGSEASNKPTSVGFPTNIRQQVLPHMQALPRLLDVSSLRVLHARMCFESGEKTILANPSGLIRGCPLAVPPVIFSHCLPNPAVSSSQNLPQILPFHCSVLAAAAHLPIMAPATYAPRIEAGQWEVYKQPILDFYLDEKHSLPETMEHMEREHGFVAT